MLGVGVIGCGAISRMHIESFLQNPNTAVRAVADTSESAAARTAGKLHAESYRDYRDMLRRKDIDIVSICTPSGLHSEAAIAAAQAGKHVIVEKPLDVTLEKVDAMIEACEKHHVKLSCIFNNRYREGNIFLKQAIGAGRFGRLINANAVIRWYREPDYYRKSPWHGTWALDGGGALMNQSIHYVDLLLWFAGDVESLSAYTGTLLHKTIETEDTAVAVLKFKTGALGALVATTSTYPGYPAVIQLTGERGSASIQDGVITSWNFLDKNPIDLQAKAFFGCGAVDNERASVPMAFACKYHAKQIASAVDSILNDTKPDIGGTEARKSVELILGVYESAVSGKRFLFA